MSDLCTRQSDKQIREESYLDWIRVRFVTFVVKRPGSNIGHGCRSGWWLCHRFRRRSNWRSVDAFRRRHWRLQEGSPRGRRGRHDSLWRFLGCIVRAGLNRPRWMRWYRGPRWRQNGSRYQLRRMWSLEFSLDRWRRHHFYRRRYRSRTNVIVYRRCRLGGKGGRAWMFHDECLAINDKSDLIGWSGEQGDGILVCWIRHVNTVDLKHIKQVNRYTGNPTQLFNELDSLMHSSRRDGTPILLNLLNSLYKI